MHPIEKFWSREKETLLQQLNVTEKGMTSKDVALLLQQQQGRSKFSPRWQKDLLLLLAQYKNPLVLLLVFAVIISLRTLLMVKCNGMKMPIIK